MFEFPVLVGDIGGTNARFGLIDERGAVPRMLSHEPTKGHPDISAAIRASLEKGGSPTPRSAVLAIAGRVERRFVGIDPVAHEARVVARLIVDLEPAAGLVQRLPEATQVLLAGVRLRQIVLPCGHAGAAEAVLHILAESAA